MLGRLEVRSSWSVQVVEAKPSGGLDPSSPASMRRAGWWSQRVLGSDSVTVAHSLSPRPNAGHQGQWEECGGRMWGLCTGHCGRISTRFTAL